MPKYTSRLSASTIVVMKGLAMTAGSKPTFLAAIGSVQPTIFAMTTVSAIVKQICGLQPWPVATMELAGKTCKVVATGGLAPQMIPNCTHDILYDETVILDGLRSIYRRNQKDK